MWASVLTVIFGAWIVGISCWILLERRSPAATIAWILALSFLPGLGIFIYLFLGPRRFNRKKLVLSLARERLATVQERLHERADRELARDARLLAEMAELDGRGPPMPVRRLTPFFEGAPFYEALLKAIEAAEDHIHLEYYIFSPDRIGTRVRDALARKAREGVEVRLLVDGHGSKRFSRGFKKPLEAAGARVAWFNSARLTRFLPRYVNFRTHRKIVVVDGRTAFTGGINITDGQTEEFAADQAWRDTHLMIEGIAARALQAVFAENWFFATGEALSDLDFYPPDPLEGEHLVQIVASGPDRDAPAIRNLFFAAIAGAEKRVLLTTPYFVPDEAILTALQTTARRGVEVRVLVPEKSDGALVNAAARTWYDALLPAGVHVHLYTPRMLHAKSLVVDDGISVVGTANMDNRSFRLNFEVVAVLYGTSPTEDLAAQFRKDLEHSRELTEEDRKKLPLRSRLLEAIARLFSPQL
jgi:cardiolipin synthase